MRSRPVGIGIIGTGFGAAVQLPGFLEIPDAQVIGVASRHAERSRELAEKYGLPRHFASAEELIACPDIALVSVAVPQSEHEELVRAAIRAGKDVLCEKPFTLSAAVALKLLKEAEAAGIIHAVDFEFREPMAWQVLKEHIGGIGGVQSATLSWISGSWADPKRPWGWQCDKSRGGGVMSALGVHLFDAAEWLLGPMESLRATVKTIVTERPDPATGTMKPATADDTADIEIRGKNGIPVRIALTNVSTSGSSLTMEIRGESATLLFESTTPEYGGGFRLREGTSDDLRVIHEDGPPGPGDARIPPFRSLAERLVDAVRARDRSFRPSFAEGIRSQMLREAAWKASETGSWLDIPGAGN